MQRRGTIRIPPDQLATLLRESHDRWGPIAKPIGFAADS